MSHDLLVLNFLNEVVLQFHNFSYSSAGSLSDLGAYYTWFLKAVAKWLDIALFKAVQRILKAVELDDLSTPVDDMVIFRNLTNL